MSKEISFDFEIPVTFFEKADAEPGKQRRIGGIASLESRDRQGETILQRGLDFSDFRNNGWFNDNHTKDTDGILGYPEKTQLFRKGQTLPDGSVAKANGHWVEGYLLEGYDKADRIWQLGQSLQKTDRRLGFSVEGKIQKRTGPDFKTIAKALVRNVAITNCPVHAGARMEILAKSLQVMEKADPDDLEKMLGVGAPNNMQSIGPVSGMNAGQVLGKQSLEHGDHQMLLMPDEDIKKKKKEATEQTKKSLTDTEAFAWFSARIPNATPEQVGRIIQLSHALKRFEKV